MNMARANLVYVICGTIAFLAVLAAFLMLELNGKNTGALLPLIIGIATVIPGTAAWRNSQEIKKQTNGPLTQGLQTVDDMGGRMSNVENTVEMMRVDMNTTMHRVDEFLKSQGH